ncbi:ankyrin repeat domain-containing protein [Endozoicomonas sp. ONNA2]|uniref:ankyrin repeat domain-containing protein n=1 Tax=Endozoicomonas sp. ONNA2 TaxID=2828741 RepID=UPI00359FC0D8
MAACHYNRVSLSDHLRWVPPLCVAAEEGREKVVEELLTAPGRLPEDKKPCGSIMAVLNSADRWGRTPLHLAVWRGHDKVVAQPFMSFGMPKTLMARPLSRVLSKRVTGTF